MMTEIAGENLFGRMKARARLASLRKLALRTTSVIAIAAVLRDADRIRLRAKRQAFERLGLTTENGLTAPVIYDGSEMRIAGGLAA